MNEDDAPTGAEGAVETANLDTGAEVEASEPTTGDAPEGGWNWPEDARAAAEEQVQTAEEGPDESLTGGQEASEDGSPAPEVPDENTQIQPQTDTSPDQDFFSSPEGLARSRQYLQERNELLKQREAELAAWKESFGNEGNPQEIRARFNELQQAHAAREQLKPWHRGHPDNGRFATVNARVKEINGTYERILRESPQMDPETHSQLVESRQKQLADLGVDNLNLLREHEEYISNRVSNFDDSVAEVISQMVPNMVQSMIQEVVQASQAEEQLGGWIDQHRDSLGKYRDLIELIPEGGRNGNPAQAMQKLVELSEQVEHLQGQLSAATKAKAHADAQTQATLTGAEVPAANPDAQPRQLTQAVIASEADKLGLSGAARVSFIRKRLTNT